MHPDFENGVLPQLDLESCLEMLASLPSRLHVAAGHAPSRALVELSKLERERARAKSAASAPSAAGSGSIRQTDAELASRISVVQNGLYKRLKLVATWADLDDEQVTRCTCRRVPRPQHSVPHANSQCSLVSYRCRSCSSLERPGSLPIDGPLDMIFARFAVDAMILWGMIISRMEYRG